MQTTKNFPLSVKFIARFSGQRRNSILRFVVDSRLCRSYFVLGLQYELEHFLTV